MNIYRISQDQNRGYDTYDSAMVIANNEDEARSIKPGGSSWDDIYGSWCRSPENVTVEFIGIVTNSDFFESQIICASFHAG